MQLIVEYILEIWWDIQLSLFNNTRPIGDGLHIIVMLLCHIVYYNVYCNHLKHSSSALFPLIQMLFIYVLPVPSLELRIEVKYQHCKLYIPLDGWLFMLNSFCIIKKNYHQFYEPKGKVDNIDYLNNHRYLDISSAIFASSQFNVTRENEILYALIFLIEIIPMISHQLLCIVE